MIIYCIFSVVDPHASKKQRRKSSRMSQPEMNLGAASEGGDTMDIDSQDEESQTTEPRDARDDLINPFWLEDKVFGRGEVDYLSGGEIQFWKDLIEKYLYPLDNDKQKQVRALTFLRFKGQIIDILYVKQAKIANDLKELRNKSVFFFSVFNALFVLIVFMLTLHKDTLYIDWPFGARQNITYFEETDEVNHLKCNFHAKYLITT